MTEPSPMSPLKCAVQIRAVVVALMCRFAGDDATPGYVLGAATQIRSRCCIRASPEQREKKRKVAGGCILWIPKPNSNGPVSLGKDRRRRGCGRRWQRSTERGVHGRRSTQPFEACISLSPAYKIDNYGYLVFLIHEGECLVSYSGLCSVSLGLLIYVVGSENSSVDTTVLLV